MFVVELDPTVDVCDNTVEERPWLCEVEDDPAFWVVAKVLFFYFSDFFISL